MRRRLPRRAFLAVVMNTLQLLEQLVADLLDLISEGHETGAMLRIVEPGRIRVRGNRE